ncbi:MAG: hypothetical protein ABW039_13075 [Sphingobium sp.]
MNSARTANRKRSRKANQAGLRKVRAVSTWRASTTDEIEWDNGAELVRKVVRGAPDRKEAGSPYENRDNAYKREAYKLINAFLKRKNGSVIKRIVQKIEGIEPKSPTFEQNPFFWGLLAIDPYKDFLNQKRLYRFSRHLLYAARHEIDPELLTGFIHQCGHPDDVCEKANNGTIEPWYPDYKHRRESFAHHPLAAV